MGEPPRGKPRGILAQLIRCAGSCENPQAPMWIRGTSTSPYNPFGKACIHPRGKPRGILQRLLIMGQLRIHYRRQVFPDNLSDIQTDYLKQLSRSLLNLLENIRNLRYRHFQLHGAFSFLIRFMGINPSKGKAPFFLPFLCPYEFHTKDLTLPDFLKEAF